MKAKRISLAIVLALACTVFLTAGFSDKVPGTEVHAGGLPVTAVQIVVFSDYQCPACRAFYLETMRKVIDTYGGNNRVSVVYRDFPLQMHRYAREASRYALAAKRLGGTQWRSLADALYTEQEQWASDGNINRIASRVLSEQDFAKLKGLLQDPSLEREIESELTMGKRLQVNSTPTFFIRSRGKTQRVVGAVTYPVLASYLNRLLK